MQDLETDPRGRGPGTTVRVEVVSGALTIALEAVARGNGAVGEKVRLEMPSSHKNLQAVVTRPWRGAGPVGGRELALVETGRRTYSGSSHRSPHGP